jgi:hypothetical protein
MQYHPLMRTTLDIDEDVLLAVKNLARREKKTVGQVVSELTRKGLVGAAVEIAGEPRTIFGFRPFPKEERIVSNELINKLREGGEC